MATEPLLQPLSGETFTYSSAIVGAEARLDIKARGFWNLAQDAYFDVRVFHPNAPCYRSKDVAAACKQHESAKKREYNQRVQHVEHGVFTPLIFTTTGSMGKEETCSVVVQHTMLAPAQPVVDIEISLTSSTQLQRIQRTDYSQHAHRLNT